MNYIVKGGGMMISMITDLSALLILVLISTSYCCPPSTAPPTTTPRPPGHALDSYQNSEPNPENKVCSTNRWLEIIDLKIVGSNPHTFYKDPIIF